jgi:hypothetical protein
MKGLNIALYCTTTTLVVATFVEGDWLLFSKVGYPMYTGFDWILSFCFIYFSIRVSQKIRKKSVDYTPDRVSCKVISSTNCKRKLKKILNEFCFFCTSPSVARGKRGNIARVNKITKETVVL